MRGTVLSQYAYSSFAPWRIMPPYSWSTPGRNPGTSTKVTIGMLNASQVRTKRAAFSLLSMSSTPANTIGWLPTTPTAWPFKREKPHTMLFAQCGKYSKNSPSSMTSAMTFFMSYGWLAEAGRMVRNDSHNRVGSSVASPAGTSDKLFCGKKLSK